MPRRSVHIGRALNAQYQGLHLFGSEEVRGAAGPLIDATAGETEAMRADVAPEVTLPKLAGVLGAQTTTARYGELIGLHLPLVYDQV